MGFSLNKNKKAVMSEINVTPLVDVMLVLLIIFMITAPIMFNGINLKLPKTSKVNKIDLSSKQVILSISATGEFYIGKEKFLQQELVSKIKTEFKENKADTLFIMGDFNLKYGKMAQIMSHLKKSGINNISLVTEFEKEKTQ